MFQCRTRTQISLDSEDFNDTETLAIEFGHLSESESEKISSKFSTFDPRTDEALDKEKRKKQLTTQRTTFLDLFKTRNKHVEENRLGDYMETSTLMTEQDTSVDKDNELSTSDDIMYIDSEELAQETNDGSGENHLKIWTQNTFSRFFTSRTLK